MKKFIVMAILLVFVSSPAWAPSPHTFPAWQAYSDGVSPFNPTNKVAVGQTPGGSGGVVINADGTVLAAGTVTAGAFSPSSSGTTYSAGNGLARTDTEFRIIDCADGESIISSGGSAYICTVIEGIADNLGDHTATQALDMGAYGIIDTGPITGATTGSFSGTVIVGNITVNQAAVFSSTLALSNGASSLIFKLWDQSTLDGGLTIGGGQMSRTGVTPDDPLECAQSGDCNGINNTFVGIDAGLNNTTGHMNTFLGHDAGKANINGDQNTFIGVRSGVANVNGYHNVFVGGSNWDSVDGNYNTYIGMDSGLHATGTNNVFVGASSGSSATSNDNTFIGKAAGLASTGGRNVFVGSGAGSSSTTGDYGVFAGYRAGISSSGDDNVFIGRDSGYNNSGAENIFIGRVAGYSNSANRNMFIGYNSGNDNTTGEHNTFMGTSSGERNTTGQDNTFTGFYAGRYNTTGSYNTVFGSSALYAAGSSEASWNNAFGYFALGPSYGTGNNAFGSYGLDANTAGTYNSAFGHQSLTNVTLGDGNVGVGYRAGLALTTGSNNTFLGRIADATVADGTNMTVIGYGAVSTKANQVVLGNTSTVETLLRGAVKISSGSTTIVAIDTSGNIGTVGNIDSQGKFDVASTATLSAAVSMPAVCGTTSWAIVQGASELSCVELTGGAETNTLETTITGIESGEIFYGTGSNAGAFTAHNFARVADSVQDAQIVAAIARDSELFGGSFSDLAYSISNAQVPTDITIDLATAASALNANPTNCAAGSYARGIAADGTAEDCTAAGSGSAPIAGTNISVSGQTVSVVGAPSFAGTVTAPNFVSSASTHALNVNNSTAPTGTFLSVGDIYTLNGEPYVAVDGTTKSVIYRAGGTDVADADIVAAIMRDSEWTAATLTAPGKSELATTTETITGTDATRAVTPDGLTDALASAGVVDWTTDQGATNIHSGNVPLAATATALAANGGNCASGEIPLGVDISGAVEGCYEPAEADITDLVHTATGITDGLIVEADLNADEAPTDNDILTYDTTGANFSWQTPGELNIYYSGGTDVAVTDGGTGTSTLTDGGILLGSGTGALTALAVATNGQIPIGDGATDPVLATITPGAGIDVTNGAGTITIDGETATLTNPGIAEFATTTEHITGTDATRAATPDGVTAALEASTKDWATTGTINGLVNVTSTTAATLALTAATCASDLHVNGDNDVITYTLPTAAAGQNCGFLTPFDAAVTVDPANTGDSIILDGTTLSAGDAASSSASAGAYAYFLAIDASQWVVIGSIKTWAGP